MMYIMQYMSENLCECVFNLLIDCECECECE